MSTILLTNLQILNSQEPFKILNSVALPVKTSFRIGILADKLIKIHQVYSAEKSKLDLKWAKKDEYGSLFHPNGDDGLPILDQLLITDIYGYNKDLMELNNCLNEISFEKIKEEDLGNVNIPPSVIIDLSWLFDLSK